jgi:hypothetical protein
MGLACLATGSGDDRLKWLRNSLAVYSCSIYQIAWKCAVRHPTISPRVAFEQVLNYLVTTSWRSGSKATNYFNKNSVLKVMFLPLTPPTRLYFTRRRERARPGINGEPEKVINNCVNRTTNKCCSNPQHKEGEWISRRSLFTQKKGQ